MTRSFFCKEIIQQPAFYFKMSLALKIKECLPYITLRGCIQKNYLRKLTLFKYLKLVIPIIKPIMLINDPSIEKNLIKH